MNKIPASELIVDFSLYPRGDVDSQHISYMVRSLEAGDTLPPIIVDGVHRWNAYRRWSGKDDVGIDCVLREYKSEADLFLDAVRLNARHGAALTTFDRAKCALRARELQISQASIAEALFMTPDRLDTLLQERVGHLRVAAIEGTSVVAYTKENAIALKRTVQHMAGRTLTKRQAEINEHLSGMKAAFHVNQLLMLIEGEMLDLGDPKLMESLRKLERALKSVAGGAS
jgi:hypothetical protein